MPAYPHEGETARIMALAPVIPVLTVASVEDGLAQAKALVAGGLYAIEVTLRTPAALAAIQAIGNPQQRCAEANNLLCLARQLGVRLMRSLRPALAMVAHDVRHDLHFFAPETLEAFTI